MAARSDKHVGVFPGGNVFEPPQKLWLWTEKNQKVLSILDLASGPLPKATNSSDVPTEFTAELDKDKVLEDKFQFVT